MSKIKTVKSNVTRATVRRGKQLVQSRKTKNNIRRDRKEVERRMGYAMTVAELISELSAYPDDSKVVFALGNRPCGKGETAGPNGEYQHFEPIMLPGDVYGMDSDIEEIVFYKKKSGQKVKRLCIVYNRNRNMEREDYRDDLEDDVVVITV